MENKNQLNQIPGEENQDEKTSQAENQKVETSQQPDINQEVSNQTQEPVAEKPVAEEPVENTEQAGNQVLEEKSEVIETVQNEMPDAPIEAEVEELVQEPVAVSIKDEMAETDNPTDIKTGESLAIENAEETETEVLIEEPVKAEPVTAEDNTEQEEKQVADKTPKAEVVVEETLKADPETKTVTEEEQVTEALIEGAEETVDDDEEEEENEPEKDVDIETLSREELIIELEKVVEEDDVNKIKARVALIKVTYLKKTKSEKETQIHENLLKDDGDEKEDTAVAEDPLEIKFKELFNIYRQKRAIYLENLEKEKLDNLKKKQDILEELKTLITSEETLKKTYDDFKTLQDGWKDIGMVPKGEVNNLWQNYHFLVEMFFDKVKINKELKDLDLKKNLEQKIDLCEKAEELLLESSIIKSFKELQRLHEKWKEVGPVPTDKNDEIWERFKSTTDKINQRRRDHYKQLQDQHDSNFEAKTGLCEKADQLLASEVNSIREWQNKTKQFNDLFKVWKTIGPAAKKQNDEIWDRFKVTLDAFFNEKKDYFGKLKDQQINNYNLKLDLSVRAEGIKESTDWREVTRELINMQKEWKQIGPVPRKHSDKIWKRFRAACDEFFNRKSEHFSSIREEETENLAKKEALIKLVAESAFDEDKSENLNKLKEFQRSWTEIGHVPFKEKDRLQTEFRKAVNKQLDKLDISSNEMSLSNYRSKMEVLKGSSDGNRTLSRERSFIQNKISKLSDDINVWENNIGFLADTKKASLFKNEFEKKITKAKDELKVLESKLKFLDN